MSPPPQLAAAAVTAAASRALGRHVVDVMHHPVGWGNENWRAAVDSGEEYIIKCASPEQAEKWAATTCAYVRARQAGLPVPRLECFESSCAELDGAVMRIFEWVDGVAPESVLAGQRQRHRFFTELGVALWVLHSGRLP